MMCYDPDRQLYPEEWSDLDESEQLQRVIDYHSRAHVKLDNPRLHAVVHVVVENQVLLGDKTPVAATLARLTREGLDRHEAIHAIGSVFSGIMYDAATSRDGRDLNETYFREVAELTAEAWLAQAN
jgi:hypothetical protein